MNVTTTSWACHRCGTTSTSEAPWYGLCDPCVADLQALALEVLPETVRCPSCGGPVCPDCHDAMPVLVPVPVPAGAPVTGPVTGLMVGYRARLQEGVTGDDH
jgi:hypothetical protein